MTNTQFTAEETKFLLEVLGQLNIKPTAPNAVETCVKIRTIVEKIEKNTEPVAIDQKGGNPPN